MDERFNAKRLWTSRQQPDRAGMSLHGLPPRVGDREMPQRVNQVAFQVRTVLGRAIAIGVGQQVAVNHQRQ